MSGQISDQRYERYRRALEGVRAPLAWLDRSAFESNIDWISSQSGSKKIRIGSKSLRSRWAMEAIFKRSAQYQGILAMSIPEAVWLFKNGFNDFLIAYPTLQRADFEGLSQAVQSGVKICLMADRIEHLNLIQNYAECDGINVRVALDLDVSSDFGPLHFGVYRSSLRGVSDLGQLMSHRQSWPNIQWLGLMAYEAQLAGVPDSFSNPLKQGLIRYLKQRSKVQVLERRQEAVSWLQKNGIHLELVNGGGTGSLSWTAQDPSVTEIAVGSGFYAPALFDHYQDLNLQPALGFALSVSRHPQTGVFTCTGGGYPASGAAGADRLPLPYLPQGFGLMSLEGAGEVQTPIQLKNLNQASVRLGDLVFFRHPKSGELCERFSTLHLIQDDKKIQEVSTYRGDGQQWM